MICGANSDLFGRRWFLIGGNILLFAGHLMCGLAKNSTTMIAGFAIIGFGAGNAQLAAFALPELLPNKWRHISVTIADLGTWVAVVIGPIAARYAIVSGDAWRWLFHAPTIGAALSVLGLYFLYFPPQHPRGLPFRTALKELDYIGGILFILAGTLILVGILYTQITSSSSPKVVGLLVGGFVALLGFIGYEQFMPGLKQPLTPTHIFTKDKGREFTFPFIVGFVVTMFYYMTNIVYPTQCAVFFLKETSTIKDSVLLTLPSNLGLVFGEILLMLFGTRLGRNGCWKWTLTGSVAIMVFFGALLGLGNPTRKAMMMVFVFLSQTGFGWAQMLSITFIQFGVPQVELGVSGGLAGVSRFAGGAIAISVYSTILTNTLTTWMARLIPAAVLPLGLPESSLVALMTALPQGSAALAKVPGITTDIMVAAGGALQQSYVHALRVTALSSLSFGIVAIIACCLCNDIGHKMDDKIEVFLENDEFADKNRFH
ncbi:MFS general substrate transporter [Lophiostoma macrostomum CBS 122681]|uniref:MFS general substrate transporter n=1 Tax=Lophiostoma macrostomum CBS 122681 TaxID=1314788 RepID=A0A6A6T0V9_9PLEO|nr:MFS general substrate transporter [Lophiostoma macrostomum CBS 122681]